MLEGGGQQVKDFYKDGKLLQEIIREADKQKIKQYYPNGQLRYEGLSKACKMHGKDVETKNPLTGDLRVVKSVVCDEVDEKMYDDRGKVFLNGIFKEYDENGTVRSETIYKDGKKIGPSKEYDEKGNLKASQKL